MTRIVTGFHAWGSPNFRETSDLDFRLVDFHFQTSPATSSPHPQTTVSPVQYYISTPDAVLTGENAYIEVYIPDDMDWEDVYVPQNQAAVITRFAVDLVVQGIVINGAWDGFRISRGSYGATIRDCAVFRCRDDVVEFDTSLDLFGASFTFQDVLTVGFRQLISTRPGGDNDPAGGHHIYFNGGIHVSNQTLNINANASDAWNAGIVRKTDAGITHHFDGAVFAYDEAPTQGEPTSHIASLVSAGANADDTVTNCTFVWLGAGAVPAKFGLDNHPGGWTVISGSGAVNHLGVQGTSAKDWLENYLVAWIDARPNLAGTIRSKIDWDTVLSTNARTVLLPGMNAKMAGGGAPSQGVTFDGPQIPANSAGPSIDFAGAACLRYAHVAPTLDLAQGTLVAFVRPDAGSLATSRGIVTRRRSGPGSPTGGFGVHWTGSALRFEIHDGATAHGAEAAGALVEGVDQCVIATWGAGGMVLRVNRQVRATNGHTGGIPATQDEDWLVGAHGFAGVLGGFWQGLISHAQIYARALSDQEIATVCPYEPPSELSAITSRNPSVYLPLGGATPADASANALPVVVVGSGLATGQPMARGDGVRLGGNCHLRVDYAQAVFSVDTGALDEDVQCEVAGTADVVVHALGTGGVIMSMEDTDAVHGHRWALVWHGDGSPELRVHQPWQTARMRGPPGLIAAGTQFNVQFTWGRNGIMVRFGGRKLEDGINNALGWHGLDRRERNHPARCTSAFRVGATGNSGNSDITVGHVALFVRSGFANRFGDADCQAIAGASGSPYPHRVWGRSEVSVGTGLNVLQNPINGRSNADGGRVLLDAGTYTQSTDLYLDSKVELVGQGRGSTIINLTNDSRVLTNIPSLNAFAAPSIGVLDRTISQSNNLSDDAVLVPVRTEGWVTSWTLDVADNPNEVKSELMPVERRNGSTIWLDRRPQFSYTTAERDSMGVFEPIVDVGLRDLSIRRTHTGAGNNSARNTFVLQVYGIRRLRMSGVEVREFHVGQQPCAFQPYGCVDVWTDPENECLFRSDGANQGSGWHSYGTQVTACRGVVLHGADLYGREWHAFDAGSNNIAQEWPGSMSTSLQVISNNLATVACKFRGESAGISGQRARVNCHGGVKGFRAFYCTLPDGGGLGFGGGYYDVVDLQASAGGEGANLTFFDSGWRGYVYRFNSAMSATAWVQGGGSDTFRGMVLSDVTKVGTGGNTGNGNFAENSWRNMTAPTPPGTNQNAAAPADPY